MNAKEAYLLDKAADETGVYPTFRNQTTIGGLVERGYLTEPQIPFAKSLPVHLITDAGQTALNDWNAKQKKDALIEKAEQLGVPGNVALADYINKLESRIVSLERVVHNLCDQSI